MSTISEIQPVAGLSDVKESPQRQTNEEQFYEKCTYREVALIKASKKKQKVRFYLSIELPFCKRDEDGYAIVEALVFSVDPAKSGSTDSVGITLENGKQVWLNRMYIIAEELLQGVSK